MGSEDVCDIVLLSMCGEGGVVSSEDAYWMNACPSSLAEVALGYFLPLFFVSSISLR